MPNFGMQLTSLLPCMSLAICTNQIGDLIPSEMLSLYLVLQLLGVDLEGSAMCPLPQGAQVNLPALDRRGELAAGRTLRSDA